MQHAQKRNASTIYGHNKGTEQRTINTVIGTLSVDGFDLPRQQWSLLNRFRTEQGHCGACRRKWQLTDNDLCPCGETQTMSHIVESCPPDKTEWWLISATLCGRGRCFMADQLW